MQTAATGAYLLQVGQRPLIGRAFKEILAQGLCQASSRAGAVELPEYKDIRPQMQ